MSYGGKTVFVFGIYQGPGVRSTLLTGRLMAGIGRKGECLVKVRSGEPEKIDGETKEQMGRRGRCGDGVTHKKWKR